MPGFRTFAELSCCRSDRSWWDAEYGCATLLLATADIPADKFIRLRPNLRLFSPPLTYKGRDRYRVHGAKFKFKDLTTWAQAVVDMEIQDPDLGKDLICIWNGLHFQKVPVCPFRLACVERLESKGIRPLPKLIWLAWVGEAPPEETNRWQRYSQRYAVDHWYRSPTSAYAGPCRSLAPPNKAKAGAT